MRSFKLALGFILMASAAAAQSYPSPTFSNVNVTTGGTYKINSIPLLGVVNSNPYVPQGPMTFGHYATTITPGSLMGVDNLLENNTVYPLVNTGANWGSGAGTYTYFGVSRVFDSTTGSGSGGPVNTHMDVAINNGTNQDPVATMSYCRVVAATGLQNCFGGNDVVIASVGTTPQLIGREIDVQTDSSSVHPTSISGGLFINFFTSAFTGARGILINTLDGGSLDTGFQIAGTITGNQIKGTGFTIDPNNNFRTQGFYQATGYSAIGNNQGAYITWNKTGGVGETDFINHQGGGSSGGFFWYNTTNGTTFTSSANLSPNGNFFVSGYIQTEQVSTSALPVCGLGTRGARAFVNDATSSTFWAAPVGGGGIGVPVTCDGGSWHIG